MIWNSLPNHVTDVNTVNLFKAHLDLDRLWANQDVKKGSTTNLTGLQECGIDLSMKYVNVLFLDIIVLHRYRH